MDTTDITTAYNYDSFTPEKMLPWLNFANSIANAVEYQLDVLERRHGKERLVPFRVERLDYRTSDRQGFADGLARSGPKAVREFQEAGL